MSISGSGPGGVSRFPYITVKSNAPLDTATVRGAVSLDPPVLLEVRIDDGGRLFTVVPVELLEPSTTYRFMVDTTLLTARGGRLSIPVTRTFKTSSLE